MVAHLRQQYPQYNDIPDEQFLEGVRARFYPDKTVEGMAKDFNRQTRKEQGSLYRGASGERRFAPFQGDGLLSKIIAPTAFQRGAARAGLSGIFDAVEGAATFATDVVGRGNPAAMRAGNAIRDFIPEVDTENLAEDVGSVAVQYGAPGAGAYKAGTAVAKNAPRAIRALSGLTSAGVSDAVVANPDEDGTLGDLIGGPTESSPDDSAIMRRLKIGAEAIAVGAVADGVGMIYRSIRPYVSSKAEAQKAAREFILSNVEDPESALRALDSYDPAAFAGPDPFRPTVGTVTDDVGLKAIERTAAKGDVIGGVSAAHRGNQQAVSSGVYDRFPSQGDGSAVTSAFEQEAADIAAASKASIEEAELGLESASGKGEALLDTYRMGRQRLGDAAGSFADDVVETFSDASARRRDLYRNIDPKNNVSVSTTPLEDILTTHKGKASVEGRVNRGDLTWEQLKSNQNSRLVMQRIEEILMGSLDGEGLVRVFGGALGKTEKAQRAAASEIVKNSPRIPVTYKEIQSLRPTISAAIKKAQAAGEGNVVEALSRIKASLYKEGGGSYIDELFQAGDTQTVGAVKSAVDYDQNVFGPMFREGAGGSLRQAAKRGVDVAPDVLGARFVKANGRGGGVAAKNAAAIIAESSNPLLMQAKLDDYVLASVESVGATGQKVNPSAMRRWRDTHSDFLKQFPTLSAQVDDMIDHATNVAKGVDEARAFLKETRAAAKESEAAYKNSVAKFFLGAEPEVAVAKIMNSPSPAKAMMEARFALKGNDSALDGLREAVGQWLKSRAGGTGGFVGDTLDPIVSAKQLHTVLKEPRYVSAMRVLYSPDDLAYLRQAHSRLAALESVQRAPVLKSKLGAPIQTQKDLLDTGALALDLKFGMFRASRYKKVLKALVLKGMDAHEVERLTLQYLEEALLDPKKMAKVLRGEPEAFADEIHKFAHRNKAYVAPNLVGGDRGELENAN